MPNIIMQPPAILLTGESGVGKTDSLATLLAAGIEVFVIMTEPDAISSLIESCQRRKLSLEKLHWVSALPVAAGFSALEDMITTIGNKDYESITKIKDGVGKSETRKPAMHFLDSLRDFVCERDGQSYGSYTSWGPDRALVVDSLSGLSLMAMALTIGYKPAAHQGEWGVAMNFMESILLKMTSDRNCFFILTAHIEKEIDEISGVQRVMASTLGRKLAPKIPRFFSEVVWAKKGVTKEGRADFWWSTADAVAALKNRSLPAAERVNPDFGLIVTAYRKRVELAQIVPNLAGISPQPRVVA